MEDFWSIVPLMPLGVSAPPRSNGTKNTLGIVVYLRERVSGWQVMHILIENNETTEYLTSGGTWTKNPAAGKCYATTAVAFQAARQEAIGRFNIVFHFPQTNQIVNLDHGRGKGLPGAM